MPSGTSSSWLKCQPYFLMKSFVTFQWTVPAVSGPIAIATCQSATQYSKNAAFPPVAHRGHPHFVPGFFARVISVVVAEFICCGCEHQTRETS